MATNLALVDDDHELIGALGVGLVDDAVQSVGHDCGCRCGCGSVGEL